MPDKPESEEIEEAFTACKHERQLVLLRHMDAGAEYVAPSRDFHVTEADDLSASADILRSLGQRRHVDAQASAVS